jgi:transcriptional regulator with XRE-family HTH domain
MSPHSGQNRDGLPKFRAANSLIGHNINRLRLAAMFTRKALAEEIGIDTGLLSDLETGQESIPIGMVSDIAATFGISLQELIVELGKDGKGPVITDKQIVGEMAVLTPDRIEVLRLRDVIEGERRRAERQFELLTTRRGMDNIFTREAARRLGRLTCVLGVNDD